MRRPYVVADVFTGTPLEGNQLAVFPDSAGLPEDLMQRVARELNLSETVFVTERSSSPARASIRIFTPACELPFAGHPVLGTAFVLGAAGKEPAIVLETLSGPVPIALSRDGAGEITFGEMEQPLPVPVSFSAVSELLAALGCGAPALPVEAYSNGPGHVCVTLAAASEVTALSPDFTALGALGPLNISCFALEGEVVRTRMFAPGIGVAEDPATGSAAGPLVVHLARHERIPLGQRITISQGTEIGRPSTLFAQVRGSPDEITQVLVGGSAVIVAWGEYRVA